jgi:hypothetical protein
MARNTAQPRASASPVLQTSTSTRLPNPAKAAQQAVLVAQLTPTLEVWIVNHALQGTLLTLPKLFVLLIAPLAKTTIGHWVSAQAANQDTTSRQLLVCNAQVDAQVASLLMVLSSDNSSCNSGCDASASYSNVLSTCVCPSGGQYMDGNGICNQCPSNCTSCYLDSSSQNV